jgi:hypothetical protein
MKKLILLLSFIFVPMLVHANDNLITLNQAYNEVSATFDSETIVIAQWSFVPNSYIEKIMFLGIKDGSINLYIIWKWDTMNQRWYKSYYTSFRKAQAVYSN